MGSVLLTGDINLVGVDDPDEPLRKVQNDLAAADAVFANLESTLFVMPTDFSVKNEGFYADPEVSIRILKQAHVSAVGVANNVNYGSEAILASMACLDEAGIPHSGAGRDEGEANRPAVIERGGKKYGFLQRSSVYWATNHAAEASSPGIAVLPGHTAYEVPMYRYNASIPPVNRPGIPPKVLTWADDDHLKMFTDQVAQLREEADVLITSHHWGLGNQVLDYMTEIAHASIDAGADVVMGHGPHTPLPIEFYRNKPIFYGLGCFSFKTGHLGMSHGDWIGLVVQVDDDDASPRCSFRFVRHNEQNETYFREVDDEQSALTWLADHSKPLGSDLRADGPVVRVSPQ